MKRVVKYINKLNGEEKLYKSVSTLVKENQTVVRVKIGAVWNGLHKCNGTYENRNVIITYVDLL